VGGVPPGGITDLRSVTLDFSTGVWQRPKGPSLSRDHLLRASHGLSYRRHVQCSDAHSASIDVLGFSRCISARA